MFYKTNFTIAIFISFALHLSKNSMLIYLIPFISAFIGWVTNLVAIKMLFHPRKPVKIIFFSIQGIFPKRQQQFAEKLGKLVAEELLSFEDIARKLTDKNKIRSILPDIAERIDDFLRFKLTDSMPVLSMFIGDATIEKIKSVLVKEMEDLLPQLINKYVRSHQNELDLEKIVTEKVAGFSTDKLEDILNSIMKKEFRFV